MCSVYICACILARVYNCTCILACRGVSYQCKRCPSVIRRSSSLGDWCSSKGGGKPQGPREMGHELSAICHQFLGILEGEDGFVGHSGVEKGTEAVQV